MSLSRTTPLVDAIKTLDYLHAICQTLKSVCQADKCAKFSFCQTQAMLSPVVLGIGLVIENLYKVDKQCYCNFGNRLLRLNCSINTFCHHYGQQTQETIVIGAVELEALLGCADNIFLFILQQLPKHILIPNQVLSMPVHQSTKQTFGELMTELSNLDERNCRLVMASLAWDILDNTPD